VAARHIEPTSKKNQTVSSQEEKSKQWCDVLMLPRSTLKKNNSNNNNTSNNTEASIKWSH